MFTSISIRMVTTSAVEVNKRDHQKKPNEFGFVDEQVKVINQRGEIVLSLIHVYMTERKPK